jgi:hypothetical protein
MDEHEDCPTCVVCEDEIKDYEGGYCVYCNPEYFEDEE